MFYLLFLLRFKWTYLVAGVPGVLLGLYLYASAHPSQAVEVDGTISSYVEHTRNGSYENNSMVLNGDPNTYTLNKNDFHPAVPDEVYADGKVQIWIDKGTTRIIALTLYDANDENPTIYTTSYYDNPQSEFSDTQAGGIVTGAIGAVLIAIFGIWFVVERRRRVQIPAGAVAVPVAGSAGVSPDGKWYWDLRQWRPVSDDGRWRWDGTQWQEMGNAYSAKGAPPPPSA